LLIIGIAFLIFGLINLFSYLPISFSPSFLNTPFPFEHVYIMDMGKSGSHHQIGYLPMNEAVNDPYWLVWSLALYAGIGVTSFAIWRKRK